MEFVQSIGVSLIPVLIIIMICEILKKFDKEQGLKSLYPYLPIIIGLLTSVLFSANMKILEILKTAVINSAISAYLYDTIVKKIKPTK